MLPGTYKLDMNFLAEHLCQKCLDKITESLRYSKWEYEEKKVIPLCIVDFQTLEILSPFVVSAEIEKDMIICQFKKNKSLQVFYKIFQS